MPESAIEPLDGDDDTLDDAEDDGPSGPSIPDDFAAEVEAASADREDSEQDTPAGDAADGGDDEGGVELGDVYCNALASGAASFRVAYGDAEESRETLVDRYEKRASDELQIDQYVNEYCRQHGGIDNLPPGQAIVVFSSVFALIVVAEDPDAFGNFVEDLTDE